MSIVKHIFYFLFLIDCNSDRRQSIIKYLNEKFQEILKKRKNISDAYGEMVSTHSYRVLSSFTYDGEEKALRSERVASPPPMTDTASDPESSVSVNKVISLPAPLQNISAVPEHDEFVQLFSNAKTLAQVQNRPAQMTWRGYSLDVHADFEMTRENLQSELLRALDNLIDLSETERQV